VKRILALLIVVLFMAGAIVLMAAPQGGASKPEGKNLVGDAPSLDTKYEKPFNTNMDEWFASHKPAAGQKVRFDVVFQTPRVTVATITNQGQLFGLHYHKLADELVLLIKGDCKEYVDGKWIPFHAGDFHFNPRGVIHGTDCSGEAQELHFFTPVTGDPDRVFLDAGKTETAAGHGVGDWALIDTQYKKGMVFSLDEWYVSHPIPAGQTMRVDLPLGTPRNQMTIGQKPQLDPHHHGSSDEMIYVRRGVGEMYINGQWVKITAGELHTCPRGFIHGIRPVSDDFKIFAIFTPPQANGNDRIFVGH
jgi:quercetin dioxygenase-like cupin family protein